MRSQDARHPHTFNLERLEERQLCSVSVDNGVIVIRNTDASSTPDYRWFAFIRFDASAQSLHITVANEGNTTVQSPGIKGVRIEGGDADDLAWVSASPTAGTGDPIRFNKRGEPLPSGPDRLEFPFPVTLLGHGGDDILIGGCADDIIIGGAGNDRVWGGGGSDTLQAERGIDLTYGGELNYVTARIVDAPYTKTPLDEQLLLESVIEDYGPVVDRYHESDPLDVQPKDVVLPNPADPSAVAPAAPEYLKRVASAVPMAPPLFASQALHPLDDLGESASGVF